MLLAVMSDSHDHRDALAHAVKVSVDKGAKILIHLGDLISPFMLSILKEFPGRIYLVKGNNDGDVLSVSRTIPQECPQVREYTRFLSLEIEGVRIAATHYPEYGRALAASGDYDIVFFGHTHQFSQKTIGKALLLNPGDLMGLTEDGSFCMVETDTKEFWRLYV